MAAIVPYIYRTTGIILQPFPAEEYNSKSSVAKMYTPIPRASLNHCQGKTPDKKEPGMSWMADGAKE